MSDAQNFQLAQVRPNLEQALEKAGYDLVNDPDEPNLLQARRDNGASSSSLIIDAGGQLRFSLSRQTGPEQALQHQTANGLTLNVTRQSSETLTVSYNLGPKETGNFALFLTELGKI